MSNYLKISVASLLVTNIFLLIMALIFEWKTYDQMMVFWTENLVIGLITVFKIPFCRPIDPEQESHYPVPRSWIRWVAIPFFLLHFLLFSAMHLAFITMIFQADTDRYARSHELQLFPQLNYTALLFGFIALLVNHSISYFIHFIRKKEYLRYKIDEMMFIPYKRLIFVHLIVLSFGVGIAFFQLESAATIVIFYLVKIWIDYKRHKAEHSSQSDSIYTWF